MPREATLFDSSDGSIVEAYFLMPKEGGKNIPPNWIDRASKSRKKDKMS